MTSFPSTSSMKTSSPVNTRLRSKASLSLWYEPPILIESKDIRRDDNAEVKFRRPNINFADALNQTLVRKIYLEQSKAPFTLLRFC